MRAVTKAFLVLTAFQLVCPCHSQGYGTSLMNLLTGVMTGRMPEQGPTGNAEVEEQASSMLETLNLSYAGYVDFARALDLEKVQVVTYLCHNY